MEYKNFMQNTQIIIQQHVHNKKQGQIIYAR